MLALADGTQSALEIGRLGKDGSCCLKPSSEKQLQEELLPRQLEEIR